MAKKIPVFVDDYEPPTDYYVMLMEGNEFPAWFAMHKDGVLRVPIKNGVRSSNFKMFSYNFVNPKTKKGKLVGKDVQFKYYLDEIKFTTSQVQVMDGKFFASLTFSIEIKDSFRSKYPSGTQFVYMKQIKPTYEIYAPIFQ